MFYTASVYTYLACVSQIFNHITCKTVKANHRQTATSQGRVPQRLNETDLTKTLTLVYTSHYYCLFTGFTYRHVTALTKK